MVQETPKYPREENAPQQKKSHKVRNWVIAAAVVLVVLIVGLGILSRALVHKGELSSFNNTSVTIKPSGGGKIENFTIANSTKIKKSSSSPLVVYNVKYLKDEDGKTITVISHGPGSKQASVILLY
ncbi:MAG: hypothetical protein ACYCPS_02475 [Candidatus Saccharimonadales bacterium]